MDAQSLVAYADLVISAGGTMNREAVALGTPVYTTFEGRLGAVDEALLRDGRLRRLTNADDVRVERRSEHGGVAGPPRPARTRHTPALRRRPMRALTSSVNARRLGQVGVDACLLGLAYYLAYVLRFDSGIPHRYEELLWDTIALTVAMKLVIFAMFGLYSKLWRFVDQKDFESILKAVVVSTVGLIVVLFLFSIGKHDPPRGVLALDFLLSLVFVSGARFAVRAIVERPSRGAILERAATRGADRRRRQRRPAGGVRAAPQPGPAQRAGRLRGRRPAQAGHAHRRHQGARRHAGPDRASSTACSRTR